MLSAKTPTPSTVTANESSFVEYTVYHVNPTA